METEEPIYVQTRSVACDGGGGPLGHPNVYLKIGEPGDVVCPYCSAQFVLSDDAKEAAGH
jgi:uncharacterized Zn-finger protein